MSKIITLSHLRLQEILEIVDFLSTKSEALLFQIALDFAYEEVNLVPVDFFLINAKITKVTHN